jgi:hypothetical protein
MDRQEEIKLLLKALDQLEKEALINEYSDALERWFNLHRCLSIILWKDLGSRDGEGTDA